MRENNSQENMGKNWARPKVASGTYINVFTEEYDVFVCLNEVNSAPSSNDVELISNLVYAYIVANGVEAAREYSEKLERMIESLDTQCVKFGVQVIMG